MQGMFSNPFVALAFLFLAGIVLIVILVLGLCILSAFLPVILVVAGLFVLLVGKALPMNVRLLVGFGLILIGALWLGLTW